MGHIKTFYKFMNESVSKDVVLDIMKVAKGIDYETFLRKTDSLHQNILYRGMVQGDVLQDMCFMTDYIGHAKTYGDGDVDGIVCNDDEILRFNDKTFNNMRRDMRSVNKVQIHKIYVPYFKAYKLFDVMEGEFEEESGVINFVHSFMRSDIPYSKVQKDKIKNDLLIPIMQHYASTKGKNIIMFAGGDYADYGGADEFVVNDVGRYQTLKNIWNKANKK
jgi:hypothetical protein